jgi:hypothetical protein
VEKSNALPARCYGDPAEVLEREQMSTLGCRACCNLVQVLGKGFCTEERNAEQKGVPRVGDRCRWFSLKG